MFEGGAEPDPVVAEPGLDAIGDHRIEHRAIGLVTHPVQQLAARPYVLQRRQVATLVVHAGQAIAGIGLGHVRGTRPPPGLALGGAELRPCADLVEHIHGIVGDPAIQLAVRPAIERAARRIGRRIGHAGERKRLGVVIGRMPAPVQHHHRMLRRHAVEIGPRQRPLVADLGIVKEEPLHPLPRRSLGGARLQLVDDRLDGEELDVIRIADDHLVQQRLAHRMVVAIDEPRHHRLPLGIDDLRPLARKGHGVVVAAHRHEPPAADGKGLGAGLAIIHRMHPRIADDEVGIPRQSGKAPVTPARRGPAPERRVGWCHAAWTMSPLARDDCRTTRACPSPRLVARIMPSDGRDIGKTRRARWR